LQLPSVAGLVLAVLAPILAIILSCIHSPGADSHAQHVGQERTGRTAGLVGCVFVAIGIGAVIVGFDLGMTANAAGAKGFEIADVIPVYTILGCEVSLVVAALLVGLVASIVALALGALAVHRGERDARRPSGFARAAAALGVMSTGGAAGVLLSMAVLMHKLCEAGPVSAAQAAEEADSLSAPSYVVMAVMLALLVMGLGWCFYRAIKAAGRPAEQQEQRPEGMDA